MSPDTAAIHAALTMLSGAIDKIARTIPEDEAGTRAGALADLAGAKHFLHKIGECT